MRTFYRLLVLSIVGATLVGWLLVLVREDYSLTALTLAIGGACTTLFVVPFLFRAAFPRAARVLNQPLPGLGPELSRADALAAPPAPRVERVDRVVERQVVVTRCKYCGAYTPVEALACEQCGGRL